MMLVTAPHCLLQKKLKLENIYTLLPFDDFHSCSNSNLANLLEEPHKHVYTIWFITSLSILDRLKARCQTNS